MNLKPIIQLIFLALSSLMVASISVLALRESLVSKELLLLIPKTRGVSNPLIVKAKRVMIGRDPDCDIQLMDPYVSSFHTVIFRKGKRFFVRDLKSKNGTFLNEVLVEVAPLKNGDILKIGKREFQVMIS